MIRSLNPPVLHHRLTWAPALLLLTAALLVACSPPPGSSRNPVVVQVVPSIGGTADAAQDLADQLQERSGLRVITRIPSNYGELVLALGQRRADIAVMSTLSYLLAHERFGVTAALAVERKDHAQTYRGAILVRADAGYEDLSDLDGKRVAYVDVYSVSGYVLPAMLFEDQGVHPSTAEALGSHEAVVRAVYQGEADVGFTYEGAQRRLREEAPDVEETVVALATTDPVPYEPVAFRADFPQEQRDTLVEALLSMLDDEEGRRILWDCHEITGLHPVTDADYALVREALAGTGKQLDEMVPGGGILELQRLLPDEPIPPLGG